MFTAGKTDYCKMISMKTYLLKTEITTSLHINNIIQMHMYIMTRKKKTSAH